MTLDEAIKMYISNSEYERTHGSLHGCLDFRQLAEWLKDYKRLLEQEPNTGHWIMTGDYYTGAYGSIDYVKCSCCHADSLEEGDYCPNCGAKMESEEV